MNKICLEQDFLVRTVSSVIDSTCHKLGKNQNEWIKGEEAMSLLHISSKTTLQKLRDEGCIKYSKVTPKVIVYSKTSIENYIESKAHKTF